MRGTESYAELTITSRTLTPKQIGSRTNLETDKVWRKGEQRGSSRGDPVLENDTPHVDEIRALSDEHSVTFACVIYADSEGDYGQQVFLSIEQVDLISAMGANFWADVYFLSSDAH